MFKSTDYRLAIRTFINKSPSKGRGQISRIADFLGVNTTMISQILSGTKDLTIDQAVLLTEYMGFVPLETEYFVLLVQKERAASLKAKRYFESKLQNVREQSQELKNRIRESRTLNENERSLFYSSWLFSAIRLFTSCGNGKTLDDVVEHFNIGRKKAADILHFLVETQLCIQRDKLFLLGTQTTHLESTSPHLPKHHTNWRLRALERADRLTGDEMIYTAPCSLNAEDFLRIREQIIELVKKSRETMVASPAQEVACLNIDWFWVR